MPIIRTYGDQSVFGQGAYQAGQQLGRAQRLAQQREIDARFTENRLAARERITQMETAANLADRRGGGGGGQPASSRGPETIINEFAQQRSRANEQAAMAELENRQQAEERMGMLKALEDSYSGREKDFAFHYAANLIKKGEKLPDRIQAALGIERPSSDEAEARQESEQGQIEDYEPKTQTERTIRRTLQQGRGGDVAALFDEREDAGFGQTGALTKDALLARTQLEGFAAATSDKALLQETRDKLEAAGTSPEAMAIVDERLEQIAKEDMELKAPAAFEQVVSSFQGQLTKMQEREGRALKVAEKRNLLAKNIKQTAESFGLTVEQLGQYIRENDENRRMAQQLIEQAQEAIKQSMPPADAPSGAEQQYGPNEAQPDPRQRTQPAQPGMGPTDGGGWQNPPLIPSLNQ